MAQMVGLLSSQLTTRVRGQAEEVGCVGPQAPQKRLPVPAGAEWDDRARWGGEEATLPPPGEGELEPVGRKGANAARRAARELGRFPARVDGAPVVHYGVSVEINEEGYYVIQQEVPGSVCNASLRTRRPVGGQRSAQAWRYALESWAQATAGCGEVRVVDGQVERPEPWPLAHDGTVRSGELVSGLASDEVLGQPVSGGVAPEAGRRSGAVISLPVVGSRTSPEAPAAQDAELRWRPVAWGAGEAALDAVVVWYLTARSVRDAPGGSGEWVMQLDPAVVLRAGHGDGGGPFLLQWPRGPQGDRLCFTRAGGRCDMAPPGEGCVGAHPALVVAPNRARWAAGAARKAFDDAAMAPAQGVSPAAELRRGQRVTERPVALQTLPQHRYPTRASAVQAGELEDLRCSMSSTRRCEQAMTAP